MIPGIVAQRRSGGSSYTGPLDLVPGAAWKIALSVNRALSSSFLGEDLVKIEQEVGGLRSWFPADASTGDISSADILEFLDGDNGLCQEIVNQLGSGQIYNGGGSPWLPNEVGTTKACLQDEGMQSQSPHQVEFTSGGCTAFIVCKGQYNLYIDNPDASNFIDIKGGSGAYSSLWDGANQAGGDYAGLLNDTDFYVIVVTCEFGNNSYTYNGTTAPENNDIDFNGPLGTINNMLLASGAVGLIQEILVADGIMSAPDIALVASNITAYYP